jgi:alpha-soluble NSF attachment protein
LSPLLVPPGTLSPTPPLPALPPRPNPLCPSLLPRRQAEATLKKGGGLVGSLFGGGQERYEDAADKLQRAGHAYKAAKNWAGAAGAYSKAADCFKKAKNDGDTANCFIEAARCYIKAGDSKTATSLIENEALPRMVDAGRLSQAAKLHEEVAGMLEEAEMYEDAMTNYQKAADFFSAENAASTAAKCSGKIAFLAAKTDPPDYERAAQEFERVGRDSLASNLLKFGAKGNFFNATICVLARGDIVAAEAALGRFKEMDYTFPGCRECKLLDDICAAFKDSNVDAFTDAIYNFDQISKLDPWRTTILLKIKTEMSNQAGGESELM